MAPVEAPKEWSPDGHHLLIERSIGDTYGAAIMDIDGHGPDVVPPFRSMDDWFEAWSPDGTMILVTPGIRGDAEVSSRRNGTPAGTPGTH